MGGGYQCSFQFPSPTDLIWLMSGGGSSGLGKIREFMQVQFPQTWESCGSPWVNGQQPPNEGCGLSTYIAWPLLTWRIVLSQRVSVWSRITSQVSAKLMSPTLPSVPLKDVMWWTVTPCWVTLGIPHVQNVGLVDWCGHITPSWNRFNQYSLQGTIELLVFLKLFYYVKRCVLFDFMLSCSVAKALWFVVLLSCFLRNFDYRFQSLANIKWAKKLSEEAEGLKIILSKMHSRLKDS